MTRLLTGKLNVLLTDEGTDFGGKVIIFFAFSRDSLSYPLEALSNLESNFVCEPKAK